MDSILNTAKEAAEEAGKILLRYFGKVESSEIRKKTENDFLSFVDETAEKKIIDTIHERFSGHTILAEESGDNKATSSYRWIIDPLDGTTNYLKNIPVFAVSIAVEYKDEIVAGVVYDPVHSKMYSAAKNSGAFCNDQPLQTSANSTLESSFIATGFPYKVKHFMPQYTGAFNQIFEKCIGVRRLGAAALDLAYVAAGTFDGFWEMSLKPWDMAAGAILINEAGGKITDFWNQPNYLNSSYVIASNGHIHPYMYEIIREHFPFYQPI